MIPRQRRARDRAESQLETRKFDLLRVLSEERVQNQMVALAFLLLMLGLYLGFPDRLYVFDGVLFSSSIERIGDGWQENLFNPRHLLFNPIMMLVRDILSRIGISIAAYPLIQRINAMVGALGVLLFFRLARRLGEDAGLAFVLTALLALSSSFWSRATEGQVYMLMTFFAISTSWSAIVLSDSPTIPRAGVLCATVLGAILFHTVNIVLLPIAILAFWFSWMKTSRRAFLWFMPGLLLVVLLPFIVNFHIYSLSALRSFLIRSTEAYSHGSQDSWLQLVSHFVDSRDLHLVSIADSIVSQLYSSILFHSQWARANVLTKVALGIILLALWIPALRPKDLRRTACLLGLWWSGYVLVELFWQGGEFFGAAPLAAFLAALSLALGPLLRPLSNKTQRVILGCGGVLVLMLGAWNLYAGIIPRGRIEGNLSYKHSLFVRDHTFPYSEVVISGIGESNLKPYLPYFARRNPQAVELYFNSNSKSDGLRLLQVTLQRQISHGIPIYFLSDLVENQDVDAELKRRWGISAEAVRASLGPGGFVRVATQEKDFGIFLFIPKGHTATLFSMLVLNILQQSDFPNQQETAQLMRLLATQVMPPVQLQVALKTMEASNYGATLFLLERFDRSRLQRQSSGGKFDSDFDSWRKLHAVELLGDVDAWQRSGVFHYKLGWIYATIGRPNAAKREWLEAYRLTNDPNIASQIAKLPAETSRARTP